MPAARNARDLERTFLVWIASVFLLLIFANIVRDISPEISASLMFIGAFMFLVTVVHYLYSLDDIPAIHVSLYVLTVLYLAFVAVFIGVKLLDGR